MVDIIFKISASISLLILSSSFSAIAIRLLLSEKIPDKIKSTKKKAKAEILETPKDIKKILKDFDD